MLKTKTCIKCDKTLSIENFEKHSGARDGHRNVCHSCRYAARTRLPSFEKRKSRAVDASRKWRENNPNYMKTYCKTNRARIRKYQINWEKNNQERYYITRRARQKANFYIVSNNISRKERCQYCGNVEKTQMHHYDYEKFYEVVFLCQKCHARVHANLIQCPSPVNLEIMVK